MSDLGNHCPFLNRADGRCSNNFSLERLNHAFGFCFDQYRQCTVYREMLVERQVRRTITSFADTGHSHGASPIVQITFHGNPFSTAAHRHRQHAA
jgi:hypothetical protein